jgi:hypothetical protein
LHEELVPDDPELVEPPLVDEPPLVELPPPFDELPLPLPEPPLALPEEQETGSHSAGTAAGVHPASLVWPWMH